MEGLKIMLISVSLILLLSAVSAAPTTLSESQADVSSLLELDDSQASQLHEAKLNEE